MQHRSRLTIRLLVFAIIATLSGFASIAGATYNLPANRSVTWQGNVGVKGDIPLRTTIYKTLSPSGGNDTSAIQTAINTCPSDQVVKLNAGTFMISSPITIKSNVTLRGAGMGTTKIQGVSGFTGNYVIQTAEGKSWGASINLSGGISKGSTTITTATAHGWKAGEIILIDQINDPAGDTPVTNIGYKSAYSSSGRYDSTYAIYRSMGQLVKIVSVPTSTTATLEIPLVWNYDSTLHPQGVKLSGTITSNAGIEELTVNNGTTFSSNQLYRGTIYFVGAVNSWMNKVEVIGSYTSAVKMWVAYRNTIRGCKFHEGTPATPITGPQYATSRAYGIYPTTATANLIENNQFYHLTGSLFPCQFVGNVFAYNYITDLYLDNNFQPYAMTFHGAHSAMNLIEGNYIDGRVAADNVWGSSSHNTYFRNKVSLNPSKTGGGNWNIDLQYAATYYSLIGNVLGTTGVENTYELSNVAVSGQKSIYRFGYSSDGDNGAAGNSSRPYNTVLRHGNWDSVTSGVVWNSSDDHVLPASYYLTSKPNWWNNLQWPAIGPDVSPKYPAAPAAGGGTPWGNISSKAVTPPILQPVK